MSIKGIIYLLLFGVGAFYAVRLPAYGVIVYSTITMLRPEVFSYGQLVQFELFVVTYILLIVSAFFHGKFRLVPLRNGRIILSCLFLIGIFMYLSCFKATSFDYSYYYTQDYIEVFFFCILMVLCINTKDDLNKLILFYLIGSGFIAIWAFQQHFLGNARLEEVGGGATNTSNGIAVFFVIFFPFLMRYFYNEKLLVKIVSLFMASIYISCIIFTQSRSAFLALACMVIYYLLRLRNIKTILSACAFVSLIFIFSAHTTSLNDKSYADRIWGMFEEGVDVDASASSRPILWEGAWLMAKDNAFVGVGQQHFKYRALEYLNEAYANALIASERELIDAHNTLLLIAAESGLIALALYLIAIIYYFYMLLGYEKRIKRIDRDSYIVAVALECSMIGFLICGIFHSYATMIYWYWLFVLPVILVNTNSNRDYS